MTFDQDTAIAWLILGLILAVVQVLVDRHWLLRNIGAALLGVHTGTLIYCVPGSLLVKVVWVAVATYAVMPLDMTRRRDKGLDKGRD